MFICNMYVGTYTNRVIFAKIIVSHSDIFTGVGFGKFSEQ